MPFDALLIMKGEDSSGNLITVDENDVEAVSTDVDAYGNVVVEVKKTGKKGLAAVVILTQKNSEISPVPYTDDLVVEVQASGEFDRGFETIMTFPVMRPYLRLLKNCVCTAVFDDDDIGKVLDANIDPAVAKIVSYDTALETVGGIGDILVTMQSSADVYATVSDTLTSVGGGIATQSAVAADVVATPSMQDFPGVYVGRFVTNKRYVRSKFTSADDIGKCWALIGDDCLDTL